MFKTISIQRLFMGFLLMAAVFGSCVSHEYVPYTCPDEPVSYAEDVDPIVKTKCAISGCHNGDNGDDKNWTDFEKFQAKSQTAKTKILNGTMPKTGSLTQEEIATIACWVDQGSQNN
jgi:hypothetical protein